MEIKIVEVNSRKLLRIFIHLPAKLHKNETNWMPTIYSDDWNFFNPKKNHQFESCDTIMALAMVDGKPVGRIMGIIHNTYLGYLLLATLMYLCVHGVSKRSNGV
jgi:hypothetical protein